MQDSIFLTSKQFFHDNPDSLRFSGQFAAMAEVCPQINSLVLNNDPYLRARPNLGPLELSIVHAEGTHLHNGGQTTIALTMAIPEQDSLNLIIRRTYTHQGNIENLDNGLTTALYVQLSGCGSGGIGSIKEATLWFSNTIGGPIWDLVVMHRPKVSGVPDQRQKEGELMS
ncbi:hypothetical protein MJO28_002851 [Puccinia striiformis f. sp. tritici]|uniref:Uncharacterized protein n=1 Tax=Puccinia striiformis f. sp. tritici TaxID=168172 RepID=A0ACC0EUI7_9BASI|nr:hypothetical protein MJO28_002851 [Puccinia striiformis f. sp. tritici]